MSKIKLRYVEAYRDRHGRLRRYFRRPGFKRFALPGAPGSPEFMDAYREAWEATEHPSSPLKREIGAGRTKPGSIGAAIAAYYGSAGYLALAPSTRRTYRNILERLRTEYGDGPVAGLKAKHVRTIIERKAAGGTPHAANNLLKVLRVVLRYAVDLGWRDDDPTLGVRPLSAKSAGHHSWTEAEIAAFEERWPIGTRARLAMALLLYTGQRRSDVVRMGRQHVRDGSVDVTQQKTGVSLTIQLHPELQKVLEAAPKGQLTYLTTRDGKAFTAAGFGNWFRDCCTEAGLPHCSAHGLRHAAGRRLAEAGCTPHQIAAVTGHRSLKEVERYTRAAEQRRLAQAAIGALSGHAGANAGGTELPNLRDGSANQAKKLKKIRG